MVYSKQHHTLFGGDVILNKQNPILLGGASADAYVEEIMKVMQQYDIQKVVPGHGAVGGPEVLNDFLGYFEDMKTAAANPDQEKDLVKKYADWNEIPFVMSPGATIKHYRKKAEH
jgi:glyoxylase-like metal-dependent hydrolase (beta-lactamase superfamily II)